MINTDLRTSISDIIITRCVKTTEEHPELETEMYSKTNYEVFYKEKARPPFYLHTQNQKNPILSLNRHN